LGGIIILELNCFDATTARDGVPIPASISWSIIASGIKSAHL